MSVPTASDAPLKILVVDDHESESMLGRVLRRVDNQHSFAFTFTESSHSGVFALFDSNQDLVVVELRASDTYNEAMLERLRTADPACAIVVFANEIDEATAAYLDKNSINFELSVSDTSGRIARVLHRAALLTALQRETASGRKSARSGFEQAVGARTALVDSSGTIVAVNEAWRQFGSTIAKPYRALFEGDNYLATYKELGRAGFNDAAIIADGLDAILDGSAARFQYDYMFDVQGDLRWYTVDANPLDTVTGGAVVSHVDITQRKTAEEHSAFLALHDALTGLANRSLFTDRLYHALQQRNRVPGSLAVLFIDLDHFKRVNDHYGHAVGDATLVAVADRARAAVRPGDTVARLSGDEFVVLCEGVSNTEVHSIAARIVAAVAEPIETDHATVEISASIGVAFASDAAESLDDLVRRADHAMYQAKQEGRGRLHLADSPTTSSS